MNGNVKKLLLYVEGEINKVSNFNAGASLKGSAAQTAKAKKEGYLEGLRNVQKLIRDNIPLA
tara:strand:+ start:243 stop:428 length:186 start_codon:yes stop_codon:yes gene_type:complete